MVTSIRSLSPHLFLCLSLRVFIWNETVDPKIDFNELIILFAVDYSWLELLLLKLQEALMFRSIQGGRFVIFPLSFYNFSSNAWSIDVLELIMSEAIICAMFVDIIVNLGL